LVITTISTIPLLKNKTNNSYFAFLRHSFLVPYLQQDGEDHCWVKILQIFNVPTKLFLFNYLENKKGYEKTCTGHKTWVSFSAIFFFQMFFVITNTWQVLLKKHAEMQVGLKVTDKTHNLNALFIFVKFSSTKFHENLFICS